MNTEPEDDFDLDTWLKNPPRKDRRKEKRYLNRMLRKLKVGMYVEDCRYHPSIVTEQDFYKSDRYGCGFSCESLVNGRPNSCSIFHCGPVPLSKKEALERAQVMKEEGMETYLRKFHGYTDENIEGWRKLDTEWNFDKGEL